MENTTLPEQERPDALRVLRRAGENSFRGIDFHGLLRIVFVAAGIIPVFEDLAYIIIAIICAAGRITAKHAAGHYWRRTRPEIKETAN